VVLRSIERRLERLVTDSVGRVLPGAVRPGDIARRIAREMAGSRNAGVKGRPVVANVYRIALAPADLQHLAGVSQTLTAELCDSARATAREEGWSFMGPVRIELAVDPALRSGSVAVSSRMQETAVCSGVLHFADGRQTPLEGRVARLGRLGSSTIAFDDPDVSRSHAEIRPDGAGYQLVDLGSTNGTFVNGRAIDRHRLDDGDRVRLGTASAFEFRSG